MKSLVSPNHNFTNYRAELRNSPAPLVPFSGCIRTDLTFIEENASYLSGRLINWSKMRMIGKIVMHVKYAQSRLYNLQEDPIIQNYILYSKVNMNEDELYEISKSLEGGGSLSSLSPSPNSSSSSVSYNNWRKKETMEKCCVISKRSLEETKKREAEGEASLQVLFNELQQLDRHISAALIANHLVGDDRALVSYSLHNIFHSLEKLNQITSSTSE
eukprot:TRINITY_DN4652_c0_g1_i1.p1 TRINITY_DN4652_c0_g1~~TRINITY_DN4652_c0_g1_i1.p1  ORF type:complete len:216 (+),score=71.94 TRINITY_DN4652_c0_g1_i1:276-923(+)